MRASLRALLASTTPVEDLRTTGHRLEPLLEVCESAQERGRLYNVFSYRSFVADDYATANYLAQRAFSQLGDAQTLVNLLITVRKTGAKHLIKAQTAEHEGEIAKRAETDPLDAAMLAAMMATNWGFVGDMESARRLGREALRLKDAAVGDKPLPFKRERPSFDFTRPDRNVIAFSLYGAAPRYTFFALENARAVRHVYPGWTCRFYVDDTTPEPVTAELKALGSEVELRPRNDPVKQSGLFWRFEVASDPNVDFFLVRDADSLISVREKVAVDAFLAGDALFHVMRDFYSHAELILAGMWGGVAGAIDDMPTQIQAYQAKPRPRRLGQRNQDQLFLREEIWPRIKRSAAVHDSFFGWPDPIAENFPSVGQIGPMRHVGQDMSVFMKKRG